MNPLNYATFKASKRLVDAGIVLETEAVWWKWDDQWYLERRATWESRHSSRHCIPAPSMAEVWRELPEGFEYEGNWAYLCITKSRKKDGTNYAFYCLPDDKAVCGSKKHNSNSTDALIDLLIWTRKEKP